MNIQTIMMVLGGYAYLDYYFRQKSKIGLITAIAVIGTDVIIYLYSKSEIYTSPAEISLHLVLFRICLFVLGGTYWIYGYSLLYTYFGIYLVYNIAIIRFPFLEDIMKPEGEKKDKEGQENKFNIASTPEFLFFFSTILYSVLLSIMKAVKPRGVPLEDVKLYDKTFQFWVYGFFSILLVLIIFFMILTYRTFRRKMNGIDSKTFFYVYSEKIDLFWFFLGFLYFLLSIASVATYFISEDYRYLWVGLCVPLSLWCLLNAYLYFFLNDYNYFEDIESLNKIISNHNKKITKVIKELEKPQDHPSTIVIITPHNHPDNTSSKQTARGDHPPNEERKENPAKKLNIEKACKTYRRQNNRSFNYYEDGISEDEKEAGRGMEEGKIQDTLEGLGGKVDGLEMTNGNLNEEGTMRLW